MGNSKRAGKQYEEMDRKKGANYTMNNYTFDRKNHIHLLDGVPMIGTTSVLSIISKGGLVYWASGMACETMGWSNAKKYSPIERKLKAMPIHDKIRGMDTDEYLKLLDKAYKAHAEKK